MPIGPHAVRGVSPYPTLDPAEDVAWLLQNEEGLWHLMLMGAGHTARDMFAPTYLGAEAGYPPMCWDQVVDFPDPAAVLRPASLSLPAHIRQVLVHSP